MHAQADVLDVAAQIRNKMRIAAEGGEFDLGTVLLVVGVVAGGVAALGSGWAIIAWAAGTSELVLDGIETHAAAGEASERVIKGDVAAVFIPSAHGILHSLRYAINQEESSLYDGVRANNARLEANLKGTVEPREPDLAASDRRSDLGHKTDVSQYDIEELLRCARGWLPAMAEMFHQVYLQLTVAKSNFHWMLGDQRIAGSRRSAVDGAFDLLMTAVTRTRDYLYRCGENLATIAGNYYENEERNREIARRVDAWLSEDFHGERYRAHPDGSPERSRPR